MRRPLLLAAVTGLTLAATTALGPAAAAAAAPDEGPAGAPAGAAPVEDKILPAMADAEGTVTAFVRLAAPSVADVAATGAAPRVVDAAEERIEDLVDSVLPEPAGSAGSADAVQRVTVTTDVVAGAVVRGDADRLRALAASPDVAAVYRVTTQSVTNAGTDAFTRALDTWRSTGPTGAGVRMGVIDSGIDYTHATFGGPGTPEAYAAAYGDDGTGPIPAGVTDPTKFLGGWDFAGPRYDAGGSGEELEPAPDPNPIDPPATPDTPGHGTHVAGTAAGFGVQPDGSTFRGDYGDLDDLTGWSVGPGAAPEAGVYALKVFGDTGTSTDLMIAAMDRAADPDGDNDFGDHLDVIVLSLGAEGAPADAPENLFVDELARLGVLSVTSAGNGGDVTDAGSMPGSSRSGLTVAWSVGATVTADAVEVVEAPDPAVLGRHAAQASVNYAGSQDVTAPVTFLGPDVTGCAPLTEHADRLAGTVVYLRWDDDAATRECGSVARWNNAEAAGAVGVLLGTELTGFPVAIGGNATIPGAQLTAAATDVLLPHLEAGGVVLRLGPSLSGTSVIREETLADTVSPGSARGVHGSLGIIKPDVTAPGQQVASAASGTGTQGSARSGTSMAAAHVAGIAALVRQARPGWTPAEVKAAVMNTATRDVHAGSPQGPVLGPARVGSGRVDALDAVRSTTLAYASQDPALVSVSFGVVPVGGRPAVRRTTVTVENRGTAPVRYRTGFEAATTAGGATITTTPEVLSVPAGERRLVTVTLMADPATLARDPDPTARTTARFAGALVPREYVATLSGRLVLRSADAELRVPVAAAPRLVSDLTAQPVVFDRAGDATAPLAVEGRAVGSGGWTSLMAPMELVRSSPRLEDAPGTSPSVMGAGDLRHVGFTSTAPALRAAGQDPAEGVIGIGIATQGEWASLGTTVRPTVDVDLDGDGTHDLRTVVGKAARGSDVTTARTTDADGELVGELPVNGVFGDVDTTVFDSNVVVIPLRIADLGLTAGQVPTFRVWTASEHAPPGSDGVLDEVEPFAADPLAPELWFEGGTPGDLLVPASPGSPVTVHRTADPTEPAPDLLVLHTHNATPAARAQVVDVQAPVAEATTTSLAVDGDLQAGSDVVLTASVVPAAAAGTVTFYDGNRSIGSDAVEDGTASVTVRLAPGRHRLSATFTPASPEWSGSTSAAVEVGVARATSSVRLRLSDRAITFGQRVRATVRVVASAGSPSGTVEVRAGDTVLATGEVRGAGRRGTARVLLPQDLPVGGHRLHAVYVGDDEVAGSTSADVGVRVTPATPDVALGAQSWTVERGDRPVLAVTVAGRPGAPAPTGVVTVLLDLRRVGTVGLRPDGTAELTLPAVRSRSLVTALYGGDRGYQPAVEIRTLRVR